MAEDRLLFPIWAPRFYLERSIEGSLEGSTSASSLCRSNQCINETLYHPQSPGGYVKLFWSATHIPLHPSLSPTRLKHTRYERSMAASLAFHRQASMEQILRAGTWHCHNTFTDCTQQEIIRGNIVYIPPSIHLDSAPCEATEPD